MGYLAKIQMCLSQIVNRVSRPRPGLGRSAVPGKFQQKHNEICRMVARFISHGEIKFCERPATFKGR